MNEKTVNKYVKEFKEDCAEDMKKIGIITDKTIKRLIKRVGVHILTRELEEECFCTKCGNLTDYRGSFPKKCLIKKCNNEYLIRVHVSRKLPTFDIRKFWKEMLREE